MNNLWGKLHHTPYKILRRLPRARNFSITKCLGNNYEGDGKTTVTILNREYKHLLMFDSYSNSGFRLNNGIYVVGPVAIFPRTILQWNIDKMENLTPECLSLFSVLVPKLDILILGTGTDKVEPNTEVLDFLKRYKITTEILPTQQACSTFNFLNIEGRCVAGAILPAQKLIIYEEDLKMLTDHDAISPLPSPKTD